ncbi:mitochondrial import receptor subunit TOM40B isoform X1 [Pseudophryne corroboree]|uniref:mitochondrial import receptor subunit TOM40B isoform X1 n=1 Tax=Pseudophryne corroboree TaxID=495146 RepID=UPI003081C0FA
MGNVLALSNSQVPWIMRRKPAALPNPGSFDELHKSCKEVFPQQVEGVKVVINKALSSHFQVSHHIHMSSIGQSGYHFNAKYMGDQQPGPSETFPLLVGDLDNAGSLNAQALFLLAERIRSKAVFQTHHSKFLTWQVDVEYRGDDCTGTLTLGNPDVINESVILVTHFLQSVTPRLVLGGELVYHKRMADEGAILTLAGKYSAPNWVSTVNIGYGGAHASYYHKANEQIQVGVEFEANTRLQETSFAFGYHLNIPRANMVFKGSVDSSWCVGGVLEKKLPPLPVTLALGAFMNHWKNKFHCGFSIMVG